MGITLRVYGARGGRTARDNFQGFFEHPCIFDLKTAKKLKFLCCFHVQDLEQQRVFDWFPNSPELGNPSKNRFTCWRSSFGLQFSIRTSQLKNKPGEVKWQTVFLEQNMCVMKNVRKNNSIAPFVGGSAFSFSK